MEEEEKEEREPRELTQDEISKIFSREVAKIIEWYKSEPDWYKQTPGFYDSRGHYTRGEPYNDYVERVKRVVFEYAMSHVNPDDPRVEEHKDFVETEGVAPPGWGKRIMKYVGRMFNTDLPESTKQKLRGEIREVVIGHCVNFIITRYGAHSESAYPFIFSFNKLSELKSLYKPPAPIPKFDDYTQKFLDVYGIKRDLSNIESKLEELVRLNLVRLFSETATNPGIIVRVNSSSDVIVPDESFLSKYMPVLGDPDDSQEPDSQMSTVSYEALTVEGVNSFLAGIERNSVSPRDVVNESPFLGNDATYVLMPDIYEQLKKLYPTRKKKTRGELPSIHNIDDIPLFMVLARGIGDKTDPMSHSMLVIKFRSIFYKIDIVYGKDLGNGDGTREAVIVCNGRYMNVDMYNTVQNVGVLSMEAVDALNMLFGSTTETTMGVLNDTVTWKGVLDGRHYVYHTTPRTLREEALTKDGPIRIRDGPEQVNCASLIIMCGLGSLKPNSPYPWPQSIIECSLAKLFRFVELYTYGDDSVPELLSLSGGKRITRKRKTYKKRRKSKAKFSRKSR